MKTKQKIFLAKIIFFVLKLFLPREAKIKRNDIYWNLDFSEAIDLHIFIFGSFEKEITNIAKTLQLQKYNQIIDIGRKFWYPIITVCKKFY